MVHPNSPACHNKRTALLEKRALFWVTFFALCNLPAFPPWGLAFPLSESHCRHTNKDICQKKFAHPFTRSNHLSQKICHTKFTRVLRAAIWVRRDIAYVSNMFELMQLNGDFGKIAALKWQRNRNEIGASLHVRQKLHWIARQHSHQKSCVYK